LPAIPVAAPETETATTTPTASVTSTTTTSTTAAPVQTIPAIRSEAPDRQPRITRPGFPILFAYSWIAIALLLGMYKGLDVIRLRRLIRTSSAPSSAIKERYEAIANHIGVKHPPLLCITDTLESPALAGVLMPVILLPLWMLNNKHEAAVGWALRHELIHWKHGNTLSNLLRQITMDAENPPWPQYQIGKWDENNPVTHAYGMNYLPSNWLLDAHGVILEANILSDELEATIEKHLH